MAFGDSHLYSSTKGALLQGGRKMFQGSGLRGSGNFVRASIVGCMAIGMMVAPGTLGTVSGSPAGAAAGTQSIAIGSGAVVEGTSGGQSIRFPVTLSAPATSTVTVAYTTVPGSATAGKDYTAKSGTVKFVPSTKTGLTPVEQTVSVAVLTDAAADGTETFSVALSNPTGGYVLTTASGTGTVYDEATGVSGIQVNIGDASVYEGYSGPDRTEAIPVTLSSASTSPITVDWVFVGGTALWGTDYTGTQYGTLTFAAGKRSALLPINVIPDADVGADTYIEVQIEGPTGAVIGRADGTETILDGQAGTPDLSISNSLPQIWERTPFVYSVTVTNSGNGPAPNVSITASDPAITVSSVITSGWSCGNLGGYRSPHSGWYCNSSSPLFAGESETLLMNVAPGGPGTFAETVTVGTSVAQQNNVPHSFSDSIVVGVPPIPAAPANLAVSQVGPNLDVYWTGPSTDASSLLRSTIAATAVGGSTVTVIV
ncbi:MAG TPA: Calx-beta domain-containing protein, partial [Acidimicrobiales bacterium]|nr:Calx-beta domain-containing protein [Acidimicrobiales bacterium]